MLPKGFTASQNLHVHAILWRLTCHGANPSIVFGAKLSIVSCSGQACKQMPVCINLKTRENPYFSAFFSMGMKKDLGGIASVKVSFLMRLRMSSFTQNGMELLALQHRKNDFNNSIQDSHSRCKILAVLKARYTDLSAHRSGFKNRPHRRHRMRRIPSSFPPHRRIPLLYFACDGHVLLYFFDRVRCYNPNYYHLQIYMGANFTCLKILKHR